MTRGLGTILTEKRHPVVWIVNGASFVGSYLSEKLLAKKCTVIVIDNWASGVQENLSHLANEKDFQVLDVDITAVFPEIPKPNYIFYLERTKEDAPESAVPLLKELSRGVEQLLEVALSNHAKFLFAYTSCNNERARAKGVEFATTLVGEFVKTKGLDGRTVCLADLYGPRMILAPDDPIASVLRSILYNKQLVEDLPAGRQGSTKVSPLFVEDAANGLLLAMFGANTRGKNFSFATDEMTVDEFTAKARAANSYDTSSSVNNLSLDSDLIGVDLLSWRFERNVLPVLIPIELGIAKTLKFFRENLTKVARIATVSLHKKRTKIPKKYRLSLVLFVSLLVFWFLALPPLTLAAGFVALGLTKDRLVEGDFDNAQLTSGLAKSFLTFSKEGFGTLEGLLLVGELAHGPRSSAATGALVADITARAARIGQRGKQLFEGVLSTDTKTKDILSDKLAVDIETLARDLDFLKTEDAWNTFSAKGGPAYGWDTKQLLPLAALIRQSDELLGQSGKKVYLVLFQNNMELRPTGGFIGSFGLITFEGGKLINFEVQDVYAADGQLKGHVEPPENLKEHLGEASWFLRDSNWDPDFPTSAFRAEWFLDKEISIKVDGVLAVDLDAVKELIGVVGSVKVPDFNITVDKNNFYEKTQYYAENNFFPGSSQKKDFLTAVAKELMTSLRESGHRAVPIARILSDSFSGRHMLGFLHNKQAQTALGQLGWDGGLKSAKCRVQSANLVPSAQCLTDYLMVVESNVGVNKANYGLSRSFLLNTLVEKDSLNHELTISYLNKAPAQIGYKNYLRIYVTSGATLVSASIINSTTGEKKELKVDNSQEHGREVFGMLVEVPPGEGKQVLFSWQVPVQPDVQSLAFFWQKQPGIGEDPVAMLFKHGNNLKIRLTPEASLTQGGVVGYNTVFSGDLQVNATWTFR